MRYLYLVTLKALALISICACQNKDTFHTGAESFVDELTTSFKVSEVMLEAEAPAPVDILWVIDNSASMASYQQAVKDNMAAFVTELSKEKDVEWRMGLLSTSVNNAPFLGMGSTGTFDSLTPNPVDVFNSAVSLLGIKGLGQEKAITPILNSVKKYPEFFNKKAVLALFIVTDAPEQSQESVEQFLSDLAALKGDSRRIITYGAFAAPDLGCRRTDDPWTYANSKYEAMVNANGGKKFSLCSANFGSNMAAIAANISARTQWARLNMPLKPDPDSIKVDYNGAPLKQGWRFDSAKNAIEIYDISPLSSPTGKLTVKFLRAR